jgi:hypothetical protein
VCIHNLPEHTGALVSTPERSTNYQPVRSTGCSQTHWISDPGRSPDRILEANQMNAKVTATVATVIVATMVLVGAGGEPAVPSSYNPLQ